MTLAEQLQALPRFGFGLIYVKLLDVLALLAAQSEETAVAPGGDGPPIASCLICGVKKSLAVWYGGTRHGVCESCRSKALAAQPEPTQEATEAIRCLETMANSEDAIGYSFEGASPDTARECRWRAKMLRCGVEALRSAAPTPSAWQPEDINRVRSLWAMKATQYARAQVCPLYQNDEPGTSYERGMMHQVSTAYRDGYLTALDELLPPPPADADKEP